MASRPPPNDQDILHQRFTELVEQHQLMVYRYAHFLIRDAVLAEEIAQDAFVTTYGKAMTSFPEGDVGALLRGIVRNLVLRARSRGKTRLLFCDTETLALAESYWVKSRMCNSKSEASSERMDALRACLESLKTEERKLLQLRFEEGCSRKQISGLLKLSMEGVKTRLRRIRERLLDCTRRRLANPGGSH